MQNKLKILLLSDIHCLSLPAEHDSHAQVRRAFLQDIEGYKLVNGAFDVILVSGDIAYKGVESEYDKALTFFHQLCDVSGCAYERIYVVPGNHDKNLNAVRAELRHLINQGLSSEKADHEHSSKLYLNLLIRDKEACKALYSPFREYAEFAIKMDCCDSIMCKLTSSEDSVFDEENDKAYYKQEIGVLNEYPVVLYGFNTCLNSDWFDEDDHGLGHKLFLPMLGYHALVDISGTINIAMMHHPLDRIVHSESISTFMDKHYPIQIFGHLHKPVCWEDKCLHIQSGALQPQTSSEGGDEYFSVYNILELNVTSDENGKDFLQANLSVQRYRPESEGFETLDSEGHSFKTQLHRTPSRWSNDNKQKSLTERLPPDVSKRQIRLRFLNFHDQKSVIKRVNIYTYNDNISLHENCFHFLETVDNQHKYATLWSLVK